MKAGENAVVVGMSGGIGKALTRQLLANGLNVFGFDINELELRQFSNELSQKGHHINYEVVDVTDIQSVKKAAAVAQQHGSIHYWINTAGIAHNEKFETVPIETFERVIDINLLGVTRATKVALDIMVQQATGQIVNIASLI